MDTPPEFGFGEDGEREPIVMFDYSALDGDEAPETEDMSPQELEHLGRAMIAVMRWLWQDGMKNPNGLLIRGVVLCWVFLPEVRAHTLTQIAAAFGRYKQSIGRWADKFKVEFPMIHSPHLKPLKKTKRKRCSS